MVLTHKKGICYLKLLGRLTASAFEALVSVSASASSASGALAAASATRVSAEASPGVSTPGARRLKLLGKLTAWYKMHIKEMHNSNALIMCKGCSLPHSCMCYQRAIILRSNVPLFLLLFMFSQQEQ